jgi:hypothetical protein
MTIPPADFEFQSIQGAIIMERSMKATIDQPDATAIGKQSLAKKKPEDKPKPKKDKEK